MAYEETMKEFDDYYEHIVDKINRQYETTHKSVVLDYDFLEFSDMDSNKALLCLYMLMKRCGWEKSCSPTRIFQDNPEMILTYYLIEGKELFGSVNEETFVRSNEISTLDFNFKKNNEERMKRLYKVMCDNKDLKDKVIRNAINYYIEYYDFLLEESYENATETINNIYNLLKSSSVSFEDARYLYGNVVCKHDHFKTLDYDSLISAKPEFLSVPGFIDNVSVDGLFNYFEKHTDLSEEAFDGFVCETLKNIYDSNKDRPDSIHHLITIIKEFDENKEIENQLLSRYPELKLAFITDDRTLLDAIAIIEGKDVDIANSVDLSKCDYFRDHIDQAIKSYLDNGASNCEISLAILMALARNLGEGLGLDYEVVANTKDVQADVLGYYKDEKRQLYINAAYVKPGKEEFVNNVSTIFHEVQHAIQFQKLFESDDYSYGTMCMIIDFFTSHSYGPFYMDNYRNISYEVDARSAELFETLRFINEYCPEMRRSYEENFLNKKNIDDAGIREYFIHYTTSLQSFVEAEKNDGKNRKEMIESDECVDVVKQIYLKEIEKRRKLLSRFPIFEYDEEEYRFRLKSEEEINAIRKQYEEAHDEVGMDLIDNVLYDIKLAKYLEGKSYDSLDNAIENVRKGFGGK